jgi:hypothetical protein
MRIDSNCVCIGSTNLFLYSIRGRKNESVTAEFAKCNSFVIFVFDDLSDTCRGPRNYSSGTEMRNWGVGCGGVPKSLFLRVRIDADPVETTQEKNGKVVMTVPSKVSKGGKTRTSTWHGKNAEGKDVHKVVVFDKQLSRRSGLLSARAFWVIDDHKSVPLPRATCHL